MVVDYSRVGATSTSASFDYGASVVLCCHKGVLF